MRRLLFICSLRVLLLARAVFIWLKLELHGKTTKSIVLIRFNKLWVFSFLFLRFTMAATREELLSAVKAPLNNEKVYKEECMYSFDNPVRFTCSLAHSGIYVIILHSAVAVVMNTMIQQSWI